MKIHISFFITAWICCTIWNIFSVAGTAWLVGWHNWSPWWFIIPLCFFQQVTFCEDSED